MEISFRDSLNSLSVQRKKDILTLRRIIKKYKPKEVAESFEDGQLIYRLPLKYFPDSYNGRPLLYAAISNRKIYIALNLICIHNDKKYRAEFATKILSTGGCAKASGCCYQIKKITPELNQLLSVELKKMSLKRFVKIFQKFRQ